MIRNTKYKLTIISLSILAIFSWAIARPHRICGDCMEPAIADGHLYFSNGLVHFPREFFGQRYDQPEGGVVVDKTN